MLRQLLYAYKLLLAHELSSQYNLISSESRVCSSKRHNVCYATSGGTYWVQTTYRRWSSIKHEVACKLKHGHDNLVYRRHYACHISNKYAIPLFPRECDFSYLWTAIHQGQVSSSATWRQELLFYREREHKCRVEYCQLGDYPSNQRCISAFALPVVAVNWKLWFSVFLLSRSILIFFWGTWNGSIRLLAISKKGLYLLSLTGWYTL